MRLRILIAAALVLACVPLTACGVARAQPGAPAGNQPYVLTLDGPGLEGDRPLMVSVTLPGGAYELSWTAGPPFKGAFGSCGSRFGACQVVVRLARASGERVTASAELPDQYIDAATQGSVRYSRLEPGDYVLTIDVNCSWTVRLRAV
jgi:hypothetical protein